MEKQHLELAGVYFLRFLHVSAIDANTFVASIQPPSKSDSELLHGYVSHHPFPDLFDDLRGL
jgi:hypothetical protein